MLASLRETLPQTAAVIQEGIANRLHLGVQVFVSQNGNVIADDALGEAFPGEPLTRDHVMLLLSAGKPLTAIAIGQLVERGLIGWDDSVAQHIPEFATGGKGSITLRQLLTHTGGFRNVETGWPKTSWDEIISRICQSPLEANWIPGERAGYHLASSWFILGELIRRLDGRSVEQYLRESVWGPLRGGTDARRIHHERLAPMFISEQRGELRPWDFGDPSLATNPAPGGNTRGTVRDLGRVYETLLEIRRGRFHQLLSTAMAIELTRPHRVGMFDETFQHVVDFGLGFVMNSRKYGPATVPYGFGSIASEESFGHGGSQSSIAFADPQRDLVVVIVCNGRPGEAQHQRRMRNMLTALENDLTYTHIGRDGNQGTLC